MTLSSRRIVNATPHRNSQRLLLRPAQRLHPASLCEASNGITMAMATAADSLDTSQTQRVAVDCHHLLLHLCLSAGHWPWLDVFVQEETVSAPMVESEINSSWQQTMTRTLRQGNGEKPKKHDMQQHTQYTIHSKHQPQPSKGQRLVKERQCWFSSRKRTKISSSFLTRKLAPLPMTRCAPLF